MKKVIVDYDGDPPHGVQHLRDADTGHQVDLDCLVGQTISHVERGDEDQLIFVLDGDWSEEELSPFVEQE